MGFHTYTMAGGVLKAPNPSLVGSLLVIFIVFVVTTIFLCVYQWSKLVREYREQQMASAAAANASYNSNNADEEGDQKIVILLEPMPCEVPLVYMPGHLLPTFIAMPSPSLHPNLGPLPFPTVPPTIHEDKVELIIMST